MKVPVIKKLAEEHNIATLEKAEEAILNEEKPTIEVTGDDEGEQLTHVLAAIEIRRSMEGGKTLNEAVRAYSQRVRKSIS
ncbi:MAG: hypothetical protein EA392_12390 [Cryomorphaceae bacterium]|nr:MAG: hypothetical protein EA392_12390 [Cryomorphaceae bacterium]